MKMEEILDLMKDLAKSQGMYGRYYETIMNMKEESPEDYETLKQYWESQNFKDALDFILFFEG